MVGMYVRQTYVYSHTLLSLRQRSTVSALCYTQPLLCKPTVIGTQLTHRTKR